MAIALTGDRGLFSHIQQDLHQVDGKLVALTRGVHQALANFQCLAEDLGQQPTQLYEIVLIQPMMYGYHNASRYICGGSVLPEPTEVPRTTQQHPKSAAISLEPAGVHPIVYQANFPADITAQLVSWGNQEGQVTNSDLELAGRFIY